MRGQPGLAGLVIIGHDDQRGVGPDVRGCPDHLDRVGRRIAAAAGDHWDTAFGRLDRSRDNVAVLVAGQRRAFAGRAARNEPVRAFRNLPVDELAECVFSNTAAGKRRNQSRNRAEEHELASMPECFDPWVGLRSRPDKEGDCNMSSMWRAVAFLPVALAAAPSSSAQYGAPAPAQAAVTYALPSVSASIGDWRRLRRSSNYSFADYAGFLIANPGWPGESAMRRWAEKAMRPGENTATVLAFFASKPPKTGNGYARLADAYAASGRMTEALGAAREAWASPDLSDTDEQAIWARYGRSMTRADADRRADALLFAKDAANAQRFLSSVTPGTPRGLCRPHRDADRRARYRRALQGRNWQRDHGRRPDDGPAALSSRQGYGNAAEQLAARPHNFVYRPADVERFYDMLLLVANDAAQDRNWATAFAITPHLRDALPARRRGRGTADWRS